MNFQDNLYSSYDQTLWRNSSSLLYGSHLESVLSKLANILGDSFYEYKFVFHEHRMRSPIPDFKIRGHNVILIFIADEYSIVPHELCDQFFAIFKQFYPYEKNIKNIISFPMGYSNSATLTFFRPFNERKYDASYAGNFLANRLDFYRQFTWLRFTPPFSIKSGHIKKLYFKVLTKFGIYKPRKFINTFGASVCYWSGGFGKGLPREEYAEIISETRIALCPKGFISTECFRLMETMRLGCVIISDELPPSRWYKESPIIVTKDWLHIRHLLEDLMENPEHLLDLHRKTLDWWENVCSDQAVARYLADEILRLKREQA